MVHLPPDSLKLLSYMNVFNYSYAVKATKTNLLKMIFNHSEETVKDSSVVLHFQCIL